MGKAHLTQLSKADADVITLSRSVARKSRYRASMTRDVKQLTVMPFLCTPSWCFIRVGGYVDETLQVGDLRAPPQPRESRRDRNRSDIPALRNGVLSLLSIQDH